MNIILQPEGRYEVAANVVVVEHEGLSCRYNLPKGCRRIVVERLSKTRHRLILGGFKSATVSVTGPPKVIEKLREAVL